MSDRVELRRELIEQNALNVRTRTSDFLDK